MVESLIEQRVATGMGIAKTRADWTVEKQVLEASRESLQLEVKQIEDQIDKAREVQKTEDTKSRELSDQQKELVDAAELIEKRIGEYETKILAMSQRFPQFLLDDLGPVMETLNNQEKRESLDLGSRVTNVVDVLEKAEKANNMIRPVKEEHSADGKVQSVDTVYFGLAIAYGANSQGDYAWIGYPTDNGWVFEGRPDDVEPIARLVALAGDRGDISFASVPVKISD